MSFETFIGESKYSENCFKAMLIVIKRKVEFDGDDNHIENLKEYKSVMYEAMNQYQLNDKEMLFLWGSALKAMARKFFQSLFEMLQDKILDYTFEEFYLLLEIRFNKRIKLWKSCNINEVPNNNTEPSQNNDLETLQDLPHLDKIFPLLVSSNKYENEVKDKDSIQHRQHLEVLQYVKLSEAIKETLNKRGL